MQTVAILPVKRFANAKQRLEQALPSGTRRALAEAMVADVLTALGRTAAIDEVLVVSADPAAQRLAEGYGVRAIDDPGESGQSQAVARGAGVARELGAERVLCLSGDCPLMLPAELETLLGKPRTAERYAVVIPDRHGTGTNGLLLSPPDALTPSFGPDSFGRHLGLAQQAGLTVETGEVPSLALDVDTPDDLAALHERLATQRGGAAHTRGMLQRLQRSGTGGR